MQIHIQGNDPGKARAGSGPWPRRFSRGMGILAALVLPGCSTLQFYHQAVKGHTQILWSRAPIGKLIPHPQTEPELSAKLQLVLRLRDFAQSQLDLPAKDHYLDYVDVGRSYVVWDIYAAPAYSLEAKTWWYPVVGRLSYRGYFDESQARKVAGRLEAQGYDVFVGGVDAYSTLGWFSDPVLNTFINRDETDLADLIFHELAHQKLFVKGDTDFNEAFATSVAREGVRRWLTGQGSPDRLKAWEEKTQRADEFLGLIFEARHALELVYQGVSTGQTCASGGDSAACDLQAGLNRKKAQVFDRLRADYQALKCQWGGSNEFDAWFLAPVNNARLNAEATYYELLPGFTLLLSRHGRNLPRFYAEVETLAKLPKAERAMRVRNQNH